MSMMKAAVLCNLASECEAHEIAHSAVNSPVIGALDPSEGSHGSPYGEFDHFGLLGSNLSEDLALPRYYDEAWLGLTAASSPDCSDSPVFTPAESLLCHSSPDISLPAPDSLFQPSLSHTVMSDLQSIAAESGMQSPVSYYPNSPTDGGFADSDLQPPTPQVSVSSSPAHFTVADTSMDVTSAPRPVADDSARHHNADRPYAQLLRECFMSRPDHSMSLKEIYKWFEENTNKVSQLGKGWQNSIRHNLSMNAAFRKKEATSMQLNSGNCRGGSRRTNIWVMEQWAVDGSVQSTTRYRKNTSARKAPAHRNARLQRQVNGYGDAHYILSASHRSQGHSMVRAAAGRRGGVATRDGRERQRAETQHQQHLGSDASSAALYQIGNGGWSIPRNASPQTMSSFPLPEHFRMGGTTSSMPSFLDLHGGAHAGHPQIYDQQLSGPSNSPGLSLGSSQALNGSIQISPIQSHHNSLGYVPMAYVRGGTNQASSPQDRPQVPIPQHHQTSGSFTFGSSGVVGAYTNGHGASVQQSGSVSTPSESYRAVNAGLKDCSPTYSSSGGT